MFAHALYFELGFGFKPITALVIKSPSFHGKFQTTKASPVHHMARSPMVRARSHQSLVGGLYGSFPDSNDIRINAEEIPTREAIARRD